MNNDLFDRMGLEDLGELTRCLGSWTKFTTAESRSSFIRETFGYSALGCDLVSGINHEGYPRGVARNTFQQFRGKEECHLVKYLVAFRDSLNKDDEWDGKLLEDVNSLYEKHGIGV